MKTEDQLLNFYFPEEKRFKKYLFTGIRNLLLLLFLILMVSYHHPYPVQNNSRLAELISTQANIHFAANDSVSTQSIDNRVKSLLIEFYQLRNFEPAWIEKFNTNAQFKIIYNLLDSAKYYGFPFDYFSFNDIQSLLQKVHHPNAKNAYTDLAQLEISTTFSALKALIYLNQGIVKTDSIVNHAYLEDLPYLLNEAIEQKNLQQKIGSVQPQIVQYQKIMHSLSFFIDMNLSIKYTTPSFIDDKVLAKSFYYAGISESPKFNSSNKKSNALYKLQGRYLLPHDSVLNHATHEKLVSLLEQKYYQACLNLHRLRKLNHSGNSYLFVNIPEFKLQVIESNQIKRVFNVIVGKTHTPTPVFSSSLEKVVANPYWTVPKSIVHKEMIHKIRKDSSYLSRNGYFIINNNEERMPDSIIDWSKPDPLGNRYWVRQINSSYNALGQVKFLFPNEYSVYLHDTQAKSLFKTQNRTYSHGCIRLENPEQLAQYLIDKNFSQNKTDFNTLISEKEHHIIDLPQKMDIHIQYITCSADSQSELKFFNDIYNLDQKEINQILPDQMEI
ncbi:MAG: L,D-transpeptidase family protein [Bacteroidota bacterium]